MVWQLLKPVSLEIRIYRKTLTVSLVPDLHSRYFVADFSYGLTCIRQAAGIAGVSTPNIDRILNWYRSVAIEKAEFRFSDYGIIDRTSLAEFYLCQKDRIQ